MLSTVPVESYVLLGVSVYKNAIHEHGFSPHIKDF